MCHPGEDVQTASDEKVQGSGERIGSRSGFVVKLEAEAMRMDEISQEKMCKGKQRNRALWKNRTLRAADGED